MSTYSSQLYHLYDIDEMRMYSFYNFNLFLMNGNDMNMRIESDTVLTIPEHFFRFLGQVRLSLSPSDHYLILTKCDLGSVLSQVSLCLSMFCV